MSPSLFPRVSCHLWRAGFWSPFRAFVDGYEAVPYDPDSLSKKQRIPFVTEPISVGVDGFPAIFHSHQSTAYGRSRDIERLRYDELRVVLAALKSFNGFFNDNFTIFKHTER